MSKQPLYPHIPKSRNPQSEEDVTIERYHGFITLVGSATVRTLPLPD